MLGVMVLLIAAQAAASIKPALNVHVLAPRNADPAPTIDGAIDGVWGDHNSSVMPIQVANVSQLLRVYTCVFNDFIYFGLRLLTSTHASNESFAIACSNLGPGSNLVNDSVYSYSVAKIVRIDGKSWDWKVLQSQKLFTNWTEGNSIDLKVGFGASNHSFYEMRMKLVLPRDEGGDLNWSRKQSYAIKIYYGTLYGDYGGLPLYQPQLGNWTSSTQKISITIPAAPDDITSQEIKELEWNQLIGKVFMFVASGFALAMVGVFIVRTKSRIRRI